MALAKKRIREATGKKQIRNDFALKKLYASVEIIEETLKPFYVHMTKLLHKHVFGEDPTYKQIVSYRGHKIVHGSPYLKFITKDYSARTYPETLLPRAFDKIRLTNPKLFKEKIAVWEKKALNDLPSDAITFETFKSGDKAIHLGYGRYISPDTFRRLEKKSKTAEQVYEAYPFNNGSELTRADIKGTNFNMKDPYTTKQLTRNNLQFVTLYKTPASKKSSPSPKTAAATKIQARVRGIRNRKKVASLKKNNQRTKILKALQARGL